MQAICDKVIDDYVKLYNEGDLIHADISEYNILVEGAGTADPHPRFIDIGQGVLKNHPMAQEFLDRDLKNLTAFFRRRGCEADVMAVKARLKHERTMSKDKGEDRLEDEEDRGKSFPRPVRKSPKPERARRRRPIQPSPSSDSTEDSP
jgi:serine/threonine-protein kinase RIO1